MQTVFTRAVGASTFTLAVQAPGFHMTVWALDTILQRRKGAPRDNVFEAINMFKCKHWL